MKKSLVMARPLRIQFPGALYHVTSRGNARNPIFLDDTDRFHFLDFLGSAVQRCNWLCHAYCLMGNHYHLLIETPNANLSKGMHLLNGNHTNRFNKRHETVGHIFQGRYKAILVSRDSHLLELCRYIVLNPLRAGMVSDAADYRWSSYRGTLGQAHPPPWLSTSWILNQFGAERNQSRERYRQFVIAGHNQTSIWADVQGDLLMGSKEFAADVASNIVPRDNNDDIPKCQRLLNRPALSTLFEDGPGSAKAVRNAIIPQAYLEHEYTMKAIADHLGIHTSTVSAVIKKAQAG